MKIYVYSCLITIFLGSMTIMADDMHEQHSDNSIESLASAHVAANDDAKNRARHLLAVYGETGCGSCDRLKDYIAIYGRQNIFDARLVVYNIHATCEKADNGSVGKVTLTGEVSDVRYKKGLEVILKRLGFDIAVNKIAVLPDESTRTKGCYRHALPGKGTIAIRREPQKKSEQMNSVVSGGWVRVLRAAKRDDIKEKLSDVSVDGWLMVQSDEGYVGFAQSELLAQPVMRPEIADGFLLETAFDGETTVPAGSFLCSSNGKWRLAGDSSNRLLQDTPKIVDLATTETRENILEKMSPLLGKTYIWGERNIDGIDCSGLSQWYARTRGVTLPRDAAEQSIVGRIIGFDAEGLKDIRPGDFVFFANNEGRVSHVAISLGKNEILHATRPKSGVVIQDIDPENSDEYGKTLAPRIVLIRRLK